MSTTYSKGWAPLEIHQEDNTKPHTLAYIPIHWQKQVEADFVRDKKFSVLEQAPFSKPVIWCHLIVVTRKQDGSPKRTVDLSPLNKFLK